MTKSEQARADALADAETLRNQTWLLWHQVPAKTAFRSGIYAGLAMKYGDNPDWAYAHAQIAAHAAFSMVPGLRSER